MWPFIILGAAAAAVTAIFCDDDGESHESNGCLPSRHDERTQGVSGYVRWDGTAVREYKRRPPR